MFLTNITQLTLVNSKLSSLVNKALELDKDTNLGKIPLEGDEIFVTFSNDNLQPKEDRKLELHRQYADVQIVLKGTERYGYLIGTYQGDFVDNKLEKDDVAFIDAEYPCQYVDLKAKDLIVFFPGTPHKPLCKAHVGTKVRKAVIKIKASRIKEFFE